MIELIKYIFRTDFHKKKLFFLVLGVALFVFLFTPTQADAFWPLLILGVVVLIELFPGFTAKIANTAAQPLFDALVVFFNFIFAAIAGLLQGIYIALGEFLIKITSYFISIPVSPSNPDTPAFIDLAWNFSRSFVNGLFLLILVFIGLATILRIQSYQLQRTLPLLIIIALLVNFSGVFVGFVVDIANLLTNFFLNAVGGTNALYSQNPWGAFEPDPAKLGQNVARIAFYLVGVLIYFVLMLIFGIRVLVLWVIVILAPLAFAAFILPATKRWWSQWLGALMQWAFVGVPIAFFLYLAGHAMAMKLPPTPPGIGTELASVFAPASALLLLFVGVTISLSMAPAFAQRAVSFGKTAAAVTVGVLARDAIRAGLAKSSKAQALAKRMETVSAGKGVFGKTLGYVPGVTATTRWAGRKMGSENAEVLKRDTNKAEAEAKDLDARAVASKLRGNDPLAKKTGYLNAIIKRGDIDDLLKAGITIKEIEKLSQNMPQSMVDAGMRKDTEAAFPHLIQDSQLRQTAANRLRIPVAAVTPAQIMDERSRELRGIRAERTGQISETALQDPNTTEAMLRGWDGRHMTPFLRKHGADGVNALKGRLTAIAGAGNEAAWLQRENPALHSYATSNAGREFGFTV